MDKHTVARGVAAQLFDAERKLDEAIKAFSHLTTTALDAKGELNLSATLGGEILVRGATLQTQLAGARTEAAALHGAFKHLGKLIRVRASEDDGDPNSDLGAGDKHDYPKGEATPPLRAVGDARRG